MDGIIFRTTDGARWGAAGGTGTGGNLAPLQFDENMWELLTRIQAIENDPPVAVSISGFTVIGSQFQVNMTDATTRGPYDLPIAIFRDVGIWTNNLPLLVMDFFQVPGRGYYRTLIAHTTPVSPAVFDPNAVSAVAGPTFGLPLYALVLGEDGAIYDLGFFFPGKPGVGVDNGAAIAGHVFVHPVTLSVGLTGSRAILKVAPTGDLSFDIEINNTVVGSIDFASGETDATFTFTVDVAIDPGDVLTVMKPTLVDVTAKELSITLKGTRVF